jgi:putative DNA primase/helicase
MSDQLSWALQYASLGMKVIPLHHIEQNGQCSCGNLNCGNSAGKHPIIKNWQNEASADPQTITNWWQQFPDANVGIATGAISGIIALDVDTDKGGDDSLFALESQYGKLPSTVESITGGGGRHLIFQYPGIPINNKVGSLGPGLDIRGDRGQIVAPPSIHKSGKRYEWEPSSDPKTTSIAKMPDWLLNLITSSTTSTNAQNPSQPPNSNPSNSQSSQTKIQSGKRNSYLASMAGAMRRKGASNIAIEAALLAENQARCDPPLQEHEVLKIAQSIARYAFPTVPTDDELADIWLKRYPDTAYGLGEFRRYKNGAWPILPIEKVEKEILEIMEEAKRNGFKPNSWKLKSIAKIAGVKAGIDDDLWNADHDILVCQNGTLHLPSWNIRPHSKSDYITCALPYDYDPYALAPTWEYFLTTVIKDATDFLQEFSGYSLTIDTSYELAVWLWGPTGSGKSTFITGLQTMLGDKAGILGLADVERSRFALSDLPDKTLLVSTEQPSTYLTSSYILNALISGETITIDRKFKNPLTITPHSKILWAMNELPRVAEAGDGLFRRVKVVEFGVLQGKADPTIKEKIKSEGSGILNWALEGLMNLRRRGEFNIPKCVQDATAQFKECNDIPSLFVAEKCKVDPSSSVQAQKLYDAYRQWCIDNGHKPLSSTSLAKDWKRLGFTRRKLASMSIWEGLEVI